MLYKLKVNAYTYINKHVKHKIYRNKYTNVDMNVKTISKIMFMREGDVRLERLPMRTQKTNLFE